MKSCLAIVLIMIACTVTAFGKGTNDVAIKGYDIRFPLPDGWTVTQNDTSTKAKGALCVLMKRGKSEGHQPAICIWLGGYAAELAEKFGLMPGELMALMPASGQVDWRTGKIKVSMDWSKNMSKIMDQKTKHTFAEFTVSGSDVRASVSALERENKSTTRFSISVAATRESFDQAESVADKLATHILAQINASPTNQGK